MTHKVEREGTSCENLPETHQFLKEIRAMMDIEYPGAILLAEACQLPSEVRKYFGEGDGDKFHLGFHFPVMPRIFMTIKSGEWIKLKAILEETPEIPISCQWVTFLRNHDELTLEMVSPEERQWMWEQYAPEKRMRINVGIRRRLAPLLDNDRRRIELAHSMLLTLPGSPILYYGDEICMGDNIWLDDRNGVRTPMQWDNSPGCGFTTAKKSYAPFVDSPEYRPNRVNVRDAMKDPSSLYWMLHHMIAMRRTHSALGMGSLRWVDTDNKSVAAWIRQYDQDVVLVISNLAPETQSASMKIGGCHNTTAVDVLTSKKFRIIGGGLSIQIEPYKFYWIDLQAYQLTPYY